MKTTHGKESSAMVKHQFQDVVRTVEVSAPGHYQVTFQKHAARYLVPDAKPESPLIRTLETGKKTGKEIRVTVDAQTLRILAAE